MRGKEEGLASEYGEYCAELKAAEANRFGIVSEHKLNYAYHLDATAYGRYLRTMATASGVTRIEGKIAEVNLTPSTGLIDHLLLDDGRVVEGDLFIDCTGFRALLIEEALKTGFDDWTRWLPCNRAWAVQTELRRTCPYTRPCARCGVALAHPPASCGNGLVIATILDEDAARERLLSLIDGKPPHRPRPIRFTTGRRKRYWHKNCVALGLSAALSSRLNPPAFTLFRTALCGCC